jgi:hypothetical protein
MDEKQINNHKINGNNGCYARLIIPTREEIDDISNELEKKLGKPVEVKGIIASNVSKNASPAGELVQTWKYMDKLRLKYFGESAKNTYAQRSFDTMVSAMTEKRKNYKLGTGKERFDMIIYEEI